MKDGFKIVVNGTVVAESDDYALRMRVVSERGELAAFGLTDVHELRLEVDYESEFNRHLNAVERDQRQARREAVESEDNPTLTTSKVSEPEGTSKDDESTSEAATPASSDASGFAFGDNSETSDEDE